MRSDHPAAVRFREAFSQSPHSCADHAPGSCALCGATCLRDSLAESPAGNGGLPLVRG
jgi:hypothetical protein